MNQVGGHALEHWERWKPLKDLPSTLYNDALIDNREGFILEFSNDMNDKKYVVKFEDGVVSYRNSDEGSLLKTLHYLDQQYGTDFYSEWTLFVVRNSAYKQWFLEESSGVFEPDQLQHYVFFTPHDVIEVLTTYPPSIEIL
jgi:hypothetical protein